MQQAPCMAAGELFRHIVEHCADAVVAIDTAQRILFFNAAAEAMFGWERAQVLGADLDLLIPESLRARHRAHVAAFARSEETARFMGERRMDTPGRRRDGSTFPAEISILNSADGQSTVLVAIIRDMSEQRELQQALETMASRDPLTGVLNRRAFTQEAGAVLRAARNEGQPLSLLMLDLDRFKRLNDTYGHTAGDQVLARATDCFAEELRRGDLLGRWGGEEFVVLLPNADADSALATAERLRSRLAGLDLGIEGAPQTLRVTVSIGAAVFHPEADTLDTLVARADAALYRAKDQGRNRVALAAEHADA